MALSALLTPWSLVRLAALILSLTGIIMLASILPTINAHIDILYAYDVETLYPALAFAGLAWTALYAGAWLFKVLADGGRAWHPGIDVALDFIGWGLNWGMGGLLLAWIADPDFLRDACGDDGLYVERDCRLARLVTGVEWTVGLLTIIVGYVSFSGVF